MRHRMKCSLRMPCRTSLILEVCVGGGGCSRLEAQFVTHLCAQRRRPDSCVALRTEENTFPGREQILFYQRPHSYGALETKGRRKCLCDRLMVYGVGCLGCRVQGAGCTGAGCSKFPRCFPAGPLAHRTQHTRSRPVSRQLFSIACPTERGCVVFRGWLVFS